MDRFIEEIGSSFSFGTRGQPGIHQKVYTMEGALVLGGAHQELAS